MSDLAIDWGSRTVTTPMSDSRQDVKKRQEFLACHAGCAFCRVGGADRAGICQGI